MTKHTPGPLTVTTKIAVTFQTSGAKRMLYPVSLNDIATYENIGFAFKEADATLFATAPDLLEVLKVVRNTIKELPEWLELKEQVNSAIAKAEGAQ